ncbi:uncharacterized protein LOC123523584 [Mercenaria mercenaria]|uniref:uncharacterized protein LOC123523584 n=1 Tax=Mercenaria mercenaria TaxID=6596 RepID=UPI00234E6CDE|nr:uncharacterized protein LOC123523584 [Mercenaria mercenaria]
MEGFGAAMTNSAAYIIYNSPIRHQILRDLFGNGDSQLGISYIRLPMGCSDFNALEVYTFNDIPSGQTDFILDHFSIDKDRAFVIPVIKEALLVNPNLKIMATPWSAPAWMKNNRNLNGGDFVDSWNYWHSYAMYFAKCIEAYKAEGINIESLTVQNEPILSRDDYPTMVMTVNQQKAFIRDHLGPLFRQKNIQTKILVFDHNWSDSWFPEQVISDVKVKQYVAGVAWHGYSGRHDTPSYFHEKHEDVGTRPW